MQRSSAIADGTCDVGGDPTDAAHRNGHSAVATDPSPCHLARRVGAHRLSCREANGR
jgi:hypothetical protein